MPFCCDGTPGAWTSKWEAREMDKGKDVSFAYYVMFCFIQRAMLWNTN
jgi:hypothetical protein